MERQQDVDVNGIDIEEWVREVMKWTLNAWRT